MPNPNPDSKAKLLAAICSHASTALLSDVMDRSGRRHNVMHHRLRPLLTSTIIAGWARTVRWIDMDEMDETPYDVEIELIDSLRPDDVVVHAQDIALRNAPWGELMSTAADVRNAAGCICDSCIRDVRMIKEIGFPIWYTAIKSVDSWGRGKVAAYDVPVVCGEVLVYPGDLIVADDDGVICIPSDMIETVVPKAVAKGQAENKIRDGLRKGRTLKEMYDRYGEL